MLQEATKPGSIEEKREKTKIARTHTTHTVTHSRIDRLLDLLSCGKEGVF